jgi:hypothetical protein
MSEQTKACACGYPRADKPHPCSVPLAVPGAPPPETQREDTPNAE